MAFSDDYVDDVYYWPEAEQVSSSSNREATETLPSGNTPPSSSKTTVTFIQDSITQHSDTVVKAVIHRN